MKTLTDVQDELAIAREFVEAASMACESLPPEESGPLCSVLDAASVKIRAIKEALELIKRREAGDAD